MGRMAEGGDASCAGDLGDRAPGDASGAREASGPAGAVPIRTRVEGVRVEPYSQHAEVHYALDSSSPLIGEGRSGLARVFNFIDTLCSACNKAAP